MTGTMVGVVIGRIGFDVEDVVMNGGCRVNGYNMMDGDGIMVMIMAGEVLVMAGWPSACLGRW